MDLIRRGLKMLLNRDLDTRDFIKENAANFERHGSALPLFEDEIRKIEALLTKLQQADHEWVLVTSAQKRIGEEAPLKKAAPSEQEKTKARKKKTS